MHHGNQNQLFDQRALKCAGSAQYQLGAIVERIDLHPGRQPCLKRFDFLLNRIDHVQRVHPVTRYHDSAHGFFTVAIERADAKCSPDLCVRYVPDIKGGPAGTADHYVLDVGDGAD